MLSLLKRRIGDLSIYLDDDLGDDAVIVRTRWKGALTALKKNRNDAYDYRVVH